MSLHDQIKALRSQYDSMPTPDPLRDRALIIYTQRTLEMLDVASTAGIDALKTFLETNWGLVNGTTLSPTAIPDADITNLLCDVAEFVAAEYNKANSKEPIAAIKLLMPSVTIESVRPKLFNDESNVIGEGYKDLTDKPLKEILKTHILGREGRFLLPVKLLTELGVSPETKKLENPYTPDDATEDLYHVAAEEYARLVAHSSLTHAVVDAHQQYHRLANDKSTLLGQLNGLCAKLGVNSVSGLGSENNAGAGAYAPIIVFSEYYHRLSTIQKASIPGPLKQEIDNLLNLASNPAANINATANLATCIATRRSQLLAKISGCEAILNGIFISGDLRASLIDESIIHLNQTITALTQALASKTYEGGQDNLGLNRRLLEGLGLRFNIASTDDLNIFKALSPDEMRELLTSPELRTQLINQIRTIENLIILIMELSPEKVVAILSGAKTAISALLIKTPQDLSALLISLEPEKCAAVIEGMKNEWLKIIKTSRDLGNLLEHLTPVQCTAVFEGMKSELPKIIKTSQIGGGSCGT